MQICEQLSSFKRFPKLFALFHLIKEAPVCKFNILLKAAFVEVMVAGGLYPIDLMNLSRSIHINFICLNILEAKRTNSLLQFLVFRFVHPSFSHKLYSFEVKDHSSVCFY